MLTASDMLRRMVAVALFLALALLRRRAALKVAVASAATAAEVAAAAAAAVASSSSPLNSGLLGTESATGLESFEALRRLAMVYRLMLTALTDVNEDWTECYIISGGSVSPSTMETRGLLRWKLRAFKDGNPEPSKMQIAILFSCRSRGGTWGSHTRPSGVGYGLQPTTGLSSEYMSLPLVAWS